MGPWELAGALLVLLLTPGPTNTLLALGGAERGWAGALRLVPVEIGAYLAVVAPLAMAGTRLLEAWPGARAALTAVAAAWVLWLAVALWRAGPAGTAGAVTARRVAVTTLLNPKALVFGLVLLPAAGWARLGANLLLFAALVVAVAALWAALGAALTGRHRDRLTGALRRAAALWLGALACLLGARAAGLA